MLAILFNSLLSVNCGAIFPVVLKLERVCSQFDVFDVKIYATVGIPW